MNQHPSIETLAQFANGTLPDRKSHEVDCHLASCLPCREVMGTTTTNARGRWQEALQGMHYEHLSFEVLASHVDGEATEEKRVEIEAHLEECPSCREEAADLLALRAEMHRAPAPFARGRMLWVAAAAAATIVGVAWLGTRRPVEVPPPDRKPAIAPTVTAPIATPSPVIIRDGGTDYRVVAGRIEELSPSQQSILAELIRGTSPAANLLATLRSSTGSLRDGSTSHDDVVLERPVASVLDTNRPTFRWSSPKPSAFVVEIYDDRLRIVQESPSVQSGEWQVTEPLARGELYSWQVVRLHEGERDVFPKPPAGQARFKVISGAASRELASARSKGSRLELALLYAREGMTGAATTELAELVKTNPDVDLLEVLLEAVRRQDVGAGKVTQ
jgi:hypothetical protein